ncbi:MAG: nucleoside phosphorylase [Flavobacteriales bacterium]|nr:nucleoside phosphorylase [Flavobacteriales bacterium]
MNISSALSNNNLEASELPLNGDGSIYHLALFPEDIAETILVAGDPARAKKIASYFDKIELEKSNREFHTYTGTLNGKRLTTMSTGIGTDNIDIALQELDALANIDLEKREIRKEHKSLSLIRLGTCGALQEDIPVDTLVASKYGLGFDGLLNYYKTDYSKNEISIRDAFIAHTSYPMQWAKPYVVEGDQDLRLNLAYDLVTGITATASGFYGPQGRELRLPKYHEDMNDLIASFEWQKEKILNYEMETSALYGLCASLGHKATTICAVIANRSRKEKSKDYKKTVQLMIEMVLERSTQ